MAKKKKENNKKGYKRAVLLFFFITLVSLFIFVYKIYKMDILKIEYFMILCITCVVVALVIFLLALKSKKGFTRFIAFFILIVLNIIPIYFLYNINLTESLITSASNAITKREIYNVYVLKESPIRKVSDLKDKKIGIFNNNSKTLIKAVAGLKKEVKGALKKETYYDEIDTILNSGISKEEDAIFITSTLENILNEQYYEMIQKYKVIKTIEVSEIEKVKKTTTDITKDSFVMYISGIDTYGNIGTVSRSDVNILIAVNPKTNKILLVNTPRDYYVKLHSKGAYDKLTHAGIYGIEESVNTLEDLYDIKIAYYIKVNFSSLIKLIDAIGGVEVDSKYAFSYDGYTFRKGKNKLYGKAALAFSRFRKGLPEGDISRGENQEAVIKAIIDKITSPSIITNYSSIIGSLEKSFITNISTEDIYKLAKYQMNNTVNWEVTNANALGYDSFDVTYSTGRTKLYVMKQNESSILSVKTSLKSLLE